MHSQITIYFISEVELRKNTCYKIQGHTQILIHCSYCIGLNFMTDLDHSIHKKHKANIFSAAHQAVIDTSGSWD